VSPSGIKLRGLFSQVTFISKHLKFKALMFWMERKIYSEMYIEKEIVSEIYRKCSIKTIAEALIGGQGWKKKGVRYWRRTPFGKENTPSFYIDTEKNTFACWSTGRFGNAVKLVQELEGSKWILAVRKTAEIMGITIPVKDDPETKKRRRLVAMMGKVKEYYQECLGKNGLAQAYLEGRGISKETAEEWELGWAPNEKEGVYEYLKGAGFTVEEMMAGDIFYQKDGRVLPRFWGRIMFPIRDVWGEVVAFSGRCLEDKEGVPKYVNSSETMIYKKTETFFGLDKAKKGIMSDKTVVIMEGFTDVIAAHGAGVGNAVAVCGTAITKRHIKKLKWFSETSILALDGDAAGIKAAERSIQNAVKEDMDVKILTLPTGDDPDEFLKREGLEGWKKLQRVGWVKWMVMRRKEELEGETIARGKAMKELVELVEQIPDKLMRHEHLLKISKLLKTPMEILTSQKDEMQKMWGRQTRWLAFMSFTQCILGNAGDHSDFHRTSTGHMVVEYFDGEGKMRRKKTEEGYEQLYQDTSLYKPSVWGAYIPKAMRPDGALYSNEEKPLLKKTLWVCPDEVMAHILSERGIHAVGLAHAKAFKARQGSKQLHQTMLDILQRGYDEIVWVAESVGFSLPSGDKEKANVYETEDMAKNAIASRDVLVEFLRVMRNSPHRVLIRALTPKKIKGIKPKWLLHWMMERELIPDMEKEIFGDSFIQQEVGLATPEQIDPLFSLEAAEVFFRKHKPQNIGKQFRFREGLFSIDYDTGRIEEINNNEEIVPIRVINNSYYWQEKGGVKCLTRFVLKPTLKVLGGDMAHWLYTLTTSRGETAPVRLSSKDWSSEDQFFDIINNLQGIQTTTQISKGQMRALHMYLTDRFQIKEAISCPTMGWDGERWHFGAGGFIDGEGVYYPIDEDGLASDSKKTFFYPAGARTTSKASLKELYKEHQKYKYKRHNTRWREWVDLFTKVYEPQALLGLGFLTMTIYWDIVEGLVPDNKVPMGFCLGLPESGKSVFAESLTAFWGKLAVVNFGAKSSRAASRDHLSFYRNSPAIFNECNPSNIQDWVLPFCKGIYDQETGVKKGGEGYKTTIYGSITTSALILGQEESVYQERAFVERVIPFLFEKKRAYTSEEKRGWNTLKKMERNGLGHLLSIFIQKRELIFERFEEKFVELEEKFAGLVKFDGDRIPKNYAILMTCLSILIEDGMHVPISTADIYEKVTMEMKEHKKLLKEKGIMDFFWGFVAMELGGEKRFGLDDRCVFYDKDKELVNVSVNRTHKAFKKYLESRKVKIENQELSTFKKRLKEQDGFLGSVGSAWVGWRRVRHNDGNLTIDRDSKRMTSAYQFSFKMITEKGIEFPTEAFDK